MAFSKRGAHVAFVQPRTLLHQDGHPPCQEAGCHAKGSPGQSVCQVSTGPWSRGGCSLPPKRCDSHGGESDGDLQYIVTTSTKAVDLRSLCWRGALRFLPREIELWRFNGW